MTSRNWFRAGRRFETAGNPGGIPGCQKRILKHSILLFKRGEQGMRSQKLLISTILGAIVFCCGVTVGQEPVQDIDRKVHPNLAEAQNLVVQANKQIIIAQKGNKYDMAGHAEKAREHLVQANQELKLAAEAANAANAGHKKK
jgi:hypothetical protein